MSRNNNHDSDLDLDDLEVIYDTEAWVDVSIETDNSFSDHVDISEDICWEPSVDGNSVVFNVDAQAFGEDTLVNVSILAFAVEDQYSAFTSSGVIVVG
ncbi:hypothetical protein [Falsiroseomonas sp. CW058]|uniref:hypothetical protein n=1 Tax=Falsiroseomonas sp. CW058 TaxID=3388664 RepID=UPI003D3241A4